MCYSGYTHKKNIFALYEFILEGTDLPAYDNNHMNGSGEIVRPTIPDGMIGEFFKPSIKANFDDAINPGSYTVDYGKSFV